MPRSFVRTIRSINQYLSGWTLAHARLLDAYSSGLIVAVPAGMAILLNPSREKGVKSRDMSDRTRYTSHLAGRANGDGDKPTAVIADRVIKLASQRELAEDYAKIVSISKKPISQLRTAEAA